MASEIGTVTARQPMHSGDLHKRSIVFNAMDPTMLAHCDSEYVQKLLVGGVTAIVQAVSISDASFSEAARSIVQWRRKYRELGTTVFQARSLEDVKLAKEAGRVAAFVAFEDSSALDGQLERLELLRDLGLRFLGLTYQNRNLAADGCGEESDAGLSRFGRSLVRECNDMGIVIDLSHTGRRSSLETVEASQHPVVITHGGLRHFVDIPRNKSDDELKAVAQKGGVIGIASKSGYIKPNGQNDGTSVRDYIACLSYLIDLVGVEGVIIGTDVGDERRYTRAVMAHTRKLHPELPIFGDALDPNLIHPAGLETPAGLPLVTEGLVGLGLSAAEIQGILGGNLMRVLQQIWK